MENPDSDTVANRAASVAEDLRALIALIDQRLSMLEGAEISALRRLRASHAAAQRALELAEELVKITSSNSD